MHVHSSLHLRAQKLYIQQSVAISPVFVWMILKKSTSLDGMGNRRSFLWEPHLSDIYIWWICHTCVKWENPFLFYFIAHTYIDFIHIYMFCRWTCYLRLLKVKYIKVSGLHHLFVCTHCRVLSWTSTKM